ncbi:MAG: CHAD domain-containing protein [Hyphomicrobium sp.]
MAFRFKLSESFEEGFRRIALEQLDRACAELDQKDQQAVAIHETRKALKRLRALLRLMRPAIGKEAFKSENAQLRDIGLSLSGARDRHVLLETATKLDAAGGFGRRGVADSLRLTILASNGAGEPLSLRAAADRLVEAKKRIGEVTVAGLGFAIVGDGLEDSYREARRALHHAYDEPSDEAFHGWRKGAQRHWRQMTLLSRAWPGYLDVRASEARELSQILGDDHDLAILVAFAHSDAAVALSGEVAAVIETAARRRQQELRAEARPRGERLFADGAKCLRRNIARYWDAAVRLKELERDESLVAPKRVSRQSAPRRRGQPASSKA